MSLNPETIARDNPDIEHLVGEHLSDRVNGDGTRRSEAPTQTEKPKIDNVAFYGLAGEIAQTIEPYSESDPSASLVNTLVAFGNVIGSGPIS